MFESEPIQIVLRGGGIMTDQKPIQLLNEKDSAQYIGMSKVWLRLSRQRRTGPTYIRIGRSIRYAVSDLDKFLDTHRVKHNK